ncbi:hypothetical protein BHE74_00046542 [Ensete ventricosum]|nr:hypothetical protein BHE74_00046542 [Ensete ventricosum]
MAGRGVTLVLRTSWFNYSSWIRAKEIVVIRVYGCRAFTSHRISGFRPSIKVPKSFSPCCDFLEFDSRLMLNSAKRDRIFSSMQFPKASSFASIASSDAIVYASRYVY